MADRVLRQAGGNRAAQNRSEAVSPERLAERVLIGRCLTGAAEQVCAELAADDFQHRAYADLFGAVKDLYLAEQPVNEYQVTKRLADAGRGGADQLGELIRDAQTDPTATGYYVGEVRATAARRKRIELATRALHAAEQDRSDVLAATIADLAALGNRATVDPPPELDDFLATPEPDYDWLIPGLLERGDRTILVGGEGDGKTTLIRQIGLQAACGLHPFGGNDFPPLRVYHLDLENGERHNRREYRRLRLAARTRYQPGRMYVDSRPAGLDLLDAEQARWLFGRARAARPDLVAIGPTYKLASGDPTEEQTARTVALWLDRLRAELGCALLLEAHPRQAGANGRRPERPYGASLWLRWPEYGLYLGKDGALRHWRGQRDEREWPAALQRGGEWPWTPATRARDVLWARIVEEAGKVDGQLSMRDAARLTGSTLPTVQRTIAEHRDDWDALTSSLLSRGDTP